MGWDLVAFNFTPALHTGAGQSCCRACTPLRGSHISFSVHSSHAAISLPSNPGMQHGMVYLLSFMVWCTHGQTAVGWTGVHACCFAFSLIFFWKDFIARWRVLPAFIQAACHSLSNSHLLAFCGTSFFYLLTTCSWHSHTILPC